MRARTESLSHYLPCAESLKGTSIEVLNGVVDPVVMDVSHIVPFPLFELALESLHESLCGGRRIDEEWVRNISRIGAIGEKVGGEEEC